MSITCWQEFMRLRRARKQLRQLIKDAHHARNMREDVARPDDLTRLMEAESAARDALDDGCGDPARLDAAAETLAVRIRALCPLRTYAAWRENMEVIVVAVAVAMAFRTYFIQPFKIPTSSMYPTLHGITYTEAPTRQGIWDRWPLKPAKWLVFGEWHTEIRARNSGIVRLTQDHQGYYILVDNVRHQIYEKMSIHVTPGQTVYQGQRLAAGIRIAGDHIFVNRLIWHFRQPRRGEIMVFKTTGINHPQIKKNEHYVKRMVGLPNEHLRIESPRLMINDRPVVSPAIMAQIQSEQNGYNGYLNTGDYLKACNGCVALGQDDYFACGDNQRNSLDSRYWGTVKRRNLVGPTFFVYWPISHRWGWAH